MKKFFKWLLIVVVVLAVVYLILCLFGPKESLIERSITINATPEVVMKKIGDHKYFVEKWSPWTKKDPNSKYTYEGEAGQVGHKVSWEGNKEVGKGSLTFDTITSNRVVHKFQMEGWDAVKTYMDVAPEGTGSKVTWGMYQQIGFIWRGMMLMMNMEKMIGDDYEEGLKNLKNVIEKEGPAATEYTINEMEWPEKNYIGKRDKVKFQEITKFFETNFPAAFADAEKNKLQVTGSPVGIYWEWDEKNMQADMAAAIPVATAPKNLKGWETFNFPAGKALVVDYYGAYDKTMAAHLAVDKYMAEKGLEQKVVIEEYVTDPGVEKDTTKWLTKIYYILK
jgi:effector-binding domain-containing protein